MEQALRDKFRIFSRDGKITSKEIKKGVESVGGRISDSEAQNLLLRISGSDRRMTENEYVYGIMNYVRPGSAPDPNNPIVYRYQAPPTYGPAGYVPPPPYASTAPPYGSSSYNQNFDVTIARRQLKDFYAQSCRDGTIDSKEISTACLMFGVNVPPPQATSMLQQIAGPERRITESKFVENLLQYVCTAKGVPYQPNSKPFNAYMARDKLKDYYREACADGIVETKEIQFAVGLFDLPCDKETANALIQAIAGAERKITQPKFVNIILEHVCTRKGVPPPPPEQVGPFDVNLARRNLESYYQSACSDGIVDVSEVRTAVQLFDIPCDAPTANALIQAIAGADRRITQTKFVETVLEHVCQRKGIPKPPLPVPLGNSFSSVPGPSPYGAPPQPGYPPQYNTYGAPPPGPAYQQPPPGYGAPPPGYAAPPTGYSAPPLPPPPGYGVPQQGYSVPPPAFSGQITSGPNANAPDPTVAAGVGVYFDQASMGGIINTNHVIHICTQYGVGCDVNGADQLLKIVAAPDNRITREKFVHHVGVYITRYKK